MPICSRLRLAAAGTYEFRVSTEEQAGNIREHAAGFNSKEGENRQRVGAKALRPLPPAGAFSKSKLSESFGEREE
jgi:hypothetical protein